MPTVCDNGGDRWQQGDNVGQPYWPCPTPLRCPWQLYIGEGDFFEWDLLYVHISWINHSDLHIPCHYAFPGMPYSTLTGNYTLKSRQGILTVTSGRNCWHCHSYIARALRNKGVGWGDYDNKFSVARCADDTRVHPIDADSGDFCDRETTFNVISFPNGKNL